MDNSSGGRFSFFDRFFSYLDQLRPSDRLIISLLLITFLVSLWYAFFEFNKQQIISVPTAGGTLIEGMVGAPRFVNPVLAITRADHDLVTLTYSGLVSLEPDGNLKPEIAESVTVSEDGLVYNVVMRQDQYFHDGTPIQAEDVAYTINLIQNPTLKSPLRGNWSGVVVEVLGDYELNFVLEDAYAPFMENLTVGILPKHVWTTLNDDELPFSQYNTEPVGSGPYELASIKRGPSGLISEYNLTAFHNNGHTANIDNLIVRFYQNEEAVEEALERGDISATAALTEKTLAELDVSNWQVIERPLPRVFAVFFNQNKSPAIRDAAAREALSVLVDREVLIDRVLAGYGTAAYSPVPPEFSEITVEIPDNEGSPEERLAEAEAILVDGGWEQAENGQWFKEIDSASTSLAVTLRSGNAPVFENTSAYLIEAWRPLNVEIGVELFEQSDLVQTVIRPRDYQALLFGTDIGRPLDLYPFWHSSQREDPGLNVALYTSITSDALLEDIRTTSDLAVRDADIQTFVEEIATEMPAIFLFSPSFVYLISPNVHVSDMDKLARPSERFANIEKWFMNEARIWPIFQ